MDPTVARAPAAAEPSQPAGERLPPQMIEDAATRLAWLAVVVAVIVPAAEIFQQFAQPRLRDTLGNDVNRLTSLATVLLGLGVFALRRYRLARARVVLVAGLVFAVVVAFCISLIETTLPLSPDHPVMGISSVAPWIIAVGVFVPNRPVWTLVTALAAATTWGVGYAINANRFGFSPVPFGQLAVWPFFNYLFAILAYLISRRMYGITIAAQTAVELGSYRLVSPIGEGGMGEVWKASHQMLARSAAIKLIRPASALGTTRQADLSAKRFQREANAIASLQSPHTVYLYDFGIARDGRFYYVMELLDGISLQTLVTTFGPQPAARVLPILTGICESLEEAHRQGLIHRDLKPSNVMLCKVGLTHDFVKVLDFGLAKFIAADELSTQLTMEGTTAGTPGYIAPEVAMGDSKVDGRADIYALGCIAYFLLTGSLVFTDANPMSMALKHVQAPPELPSARTELPIPADLERVVMQCLAKRPEERPETAEALADLLAGCATPRWRRDDAEAWWQRHLPPTSSLRSFAQPLSGTPAVVRRA
jgi:eukaryotic-like serine/threonine-protein kinase